MAHLSTFGPNISWIGEVCGTLDTTSLTSLVDNHWLTAGLRVNLFFRKEGIRTSPLFLLRGITILPSTPSAGCAVHVPAFATFWYICIRRGAYWLVPHSVTHKIMLTTTFYFHAIRPRFFFTSLHIGDLQYHQICCNRCARISPS